MKAFIFFSVTLFLIVTGCKKEDKIKKPACRITAVTSTYQNYIIAYDTEGRLLSVTYNDNAVTGFTYNGATITALTTQNGGVFFSKVTYTINADQLVTHSVTENDIAGTDETERDYTYRGTQLIKQTLTNSSEGYSSIRTFQWTNGNMVKERIDNSGGSTEETIYEYYTDKPYQQGDAQSWDKILEGRDIIRTKNLLKKRTSTYTDKYGTEISTTTYSYNFDNDGKIISMTASDQNNSDPSNFTYEYQCN